MDMATLKMVAQNDAESVGRYRKLRDASLFLNKVVQDHLDMISGELYKLGGADPIFAELVREQTIQLVQIRAIAQDMFPGQLKS
jgi:hypothetical protein